jgi:hypothetical protein
MKPAYFILALCFGAAVTTISWLLLHPDSPVQSSSPAVLNLVSGLQIIPTFIAIILSGNAHGGSNSDVIYWVLVFCQWSVVGLALSLIIQAAKRSIGRSK